jgi:hypothetical protein
MSRRIANYNKQSRRPAESAGRTRARVCHWSVVGTVLAVFFLCAILPANSTFFVSPAQAQVVADPAPLWRHLITEAKALKLPSKFLEQIPAGFVRFEFDDLRTFAAEYHPQDHRMVLNRALSFNRAGGTLRPLRQLAHKDLQTLYHELFHAFMDYLTVVSEQAGAGGAPSDSLIGFAREQQRCRYERVFITPIAQRRDQTEERFLSQAESWEVLNETWAVFIGWAIWTHLELARSKSSQSIGSAVGTPDWVERLSKADKEADLRGYYEPQDPAEKAIAQKRFVAPAFRISAPEVKRLMRDVLESSPDRIDRSVHVLEKGRAEMPSGPCEDSDTP